MDYLSLAAQLRATRQAEQQARTQQAQQGGAATSSGGVIGQGPSTMTQTTGYQAPQNNQQQTNPLQQGLDAYNKYRDVSKMMGSGAGSSLGATGTAYAGSGLGGTGFGLGGSLVSGGASGAGAGAGLGGMLGSYGGGAAAGGAGGFGALGSTTAGGTAGLLGGAGAAGGATLAGGGSAAAGGGAAAGGAAAGGMGGLAAMGPWGLLAAAIIGNETYAKKKGYRDEDSTGYMKDLIGGKVLEQDVEKRWSPKVDNMFGGTGEKLGLGGDMRVGANLMTGDFSNAFKGLFKDSSISKIFKIF